MAVYISAICTGLAVRKPWLADPGASGSPRTIFRSTSMQRSNQRWGLIPQQIEEYFGQDPDQGGRTRSRGPLRARHSLMAQNHFPLNCSRFEGREKTGRVSGGLGEPKNHPLDSVKTNLGAAVLL